MKSGSLKVGKSFMNWKIARSKERVVRYGVIDIYIYIYIYIYMYIFDKQVLSL